MNSMTRMMATMVRGECAVCIGMKDEVRVRFGTGRGKDSRVSLGGEEERRGVSSSDSSVVVIVEVCMKQLIPYLEGWDVDLGSTRRQWE